MSTRCRTGWIRMSTRKAALLVMTVAAAGFVVFGFGGAAYASTTPSITTSQQPATAPAGSSIADKAAVTGNTGGFTCPPQDQLGFSLGQSNVTTDPIFCSYPAVAGEDPNDFFCTYSKSTGLLVEEHDSGLCQPNATANPPSNPTGTVTFRLYNNPTASGTPLFTDTESLVAGTATSAGYTAAAAGTDYWVATYNGDSNNNPVTSAPAAEPVTITADSDLAIATHANITTNATGPSGATVTYTAPAVTDPDDARPPAASCSPASGKVFPIGATTVTCSATDSDDTPATVTTTFTVTVQGAAAQLAALAQAVQGVGPGTSLADKVALAQSDLAKNHKTDACHELTAFINEVKAQSGKTIPTAEAALLIADAKQIQAVLAC